MKDTGIVFPDVDGIGIHLWYIERVAASLRLAILYAVAVRMPYAAGLLALTLRVASIFHTPKLTALPNPIRTLPNTCNRIRVTLGITLN